MLGRHLPLEPRHVQRQRQHRHQRPSQVTQGSQTSQATVTPYFVQEQQLGFRLSQIRAGGVLQQMGLQEGDVLQKVNGLDIYTPQEALQAYQQLQTESTVRLSILRNNSPTTLTYEIR